MNNTYQILGGATPNERQIRENRTKLFTEYGFDPKGNNELITAAGRIGMGMYPMLASRTGHANEMEPGRQAMLSRFIQANSPGGKQRKLEAFSRGVASQTAGDLSKTNNYLRGIGAGSGLMSGAALDASNRDAMAVNDFGGYLQSSEHDFNELLPLLQAYAQAQNIDLDDFLSLMGITEQNSQFRQQNAGSGSILSGIAPVLGAAAGGIDWGSIF